MGIFEQFNLPNYVKGKSFADASKAIQDKFKGREDKDSIDTQRELLGRLKEAQEYVKAQEEAKQAQSQQHQMPDGSMMPNSEMQSQGQPQEGGMMGDIMQQSMGGYSNNYFNDGGYLDFMSMIPGIGNAKKAGETAQTIPGLPGGEEAKISGAEGGGPGVSGYLGLVTEGISAGSKVFGNTGVDTGGSMNVERKNTGSEALGGAAKGALAGSTFGPVGTVAGAVIGGAAGFIGAGRHNKDADEANRNKTYADVSGLSNDFADGGYFGDPTDPRKKVATKQDSLDLKNDAEKIRMDLKSKGYELRSNNPYIEGSEDKSYKDAVGSFNKKIKRKVYEDDKLNVRLMPPTEFRKNIEHNKYRQKEYATAVLNNDIQDPLYDTRIKPVSVDSYFEPGKEDIVTIPNYNFPTKIKSKPTVSVNSPEQPKTQITKEEPARFKNRSTGTIDPRETDTLSKFNTGVSGTEKESNLALRALKGKPTSFVNPNNNSFAYGGPINEYKKGGELDEFGNPKRNKPWNQEYSTIADDPNYAGMGPEGFFKKQSEARIPEVDYVSPSNTEAVQFGPKGGHSGYANTKNITDKTGEYVSKNASKAKDWISDNKGDIMRYAPVAMNAYQLAKLKKPKYESLSKLNTRYDRQFADESTYQNLVREETNANRAAILNTSGGSGAAARASLLGSQLNSTKALSDSYSKIADINRGENRQAQDFNLRVDTTNMQQSNMENDINARNKGNYDTQKSKLLAEIGNNIGDIGKEELFKKYPELMGSYYDSKGKLLKTKTVLEAEKKKKKEEELKKQ